MLVPTIGVGVTTVRTIVGVGDGGVTRVGIVAVGVAVSTTVMTVGGPMIVGCVGGGGLVGEGGETVGVEPEVEVAARVVVTVPVAVPLAVGEDDGVGLGVAVDVSVGVAVAVEVDVGVGVEVFEGDGDWGGMAVGVGELLVVKHPIVAMIEFPSVVLKPLVIPRRPWVPHVDVIWEKLGELPAIVLLTRETMPPPPKPTTKSLRETDPK